MQLWPVGYRDEEQSQRKFESVRSGAQVLVVLSCALAAAKASAQGGCLEREFYVSPRRL